MISFCRTADGLVDAKEGAEAVCCPADALVPSHLPYSAVTCYIASTAESTGSRQVQRVAFGHPLHGIGFFALALRP